MKINFLTVDISQMTGGAIYDARLYNMLVERFGDSVTLIDDNSFGNTHQEINVNHKRYEKVYQQNAKEIMDCDYLFVNSRLYTRFVNFPWKTQKNCKIIEIHHHFNFETHHGMQRLVHKNLELNFLKRAYQIICPNPYTIDRMKSLGLNNAVKLEAFDISNQIHFNPSIEHKNQFLLLGTVEPRKGADLGIKAFAKFCEQVDGYKYIIAGNTKGKEEYLNQLKEECKELHVEDKVIFTGRLMDDEKRKLLSESKIFLFPSQNEGYGLVIVEAMSYGLPVIAFNNTAMPYTVNGSNGYIVKNRDIDQMCNALVELCKNPDIYKKKQDGALETVRQLPEESSLKLEYEAFFSSLK